MVIAWLLPPRERDSRIFFWPLYRANFDDLRPLKARGCPRGCPRNYLVMTRVMSLRVHGVTVFFFSPFFLSFCCFVVLFCKTYHIRRKFGNIVDPYTYAINLFDCTCSNTFDLFFKQSFAIPTPLFKLSSTVSSTATATSLLSSFASSFSLFFFFWVTQQKKTKQEAFRRTLYEPICLFSRCVFFWLQPCKSLFSFGSV